MTYRELLEAIQVAKELDAAVENARSNANRWNGTPEEQDNADALFRTANAALDQEIP